VAFGPDTVITLRFVAAVAGGDVGSLRTEGMLVAFENGLNHVHSRITSFRFFKALALAICIGFAFAFASMITFLVFHRQWKFHIFTG